MKKTFNLVVLVSVMLVIVLATGCINKKNSEPNFEVLDSKVDYIVIKDKKIYVTKNFKDFTLQFKGLECTLNQDEEIDDIDENAPIFTNTHRLGNTIECYSTDKREWDKEIGVYLFMNTKTESDIGEIYYWGFSSTPQGSFDLHISNKTLLFGGEVVRIPSTLNNVVEILGNNYEEYSGTYCENCKYYKYNDDNSKYEIEFESETNKLESFILSIPHPQ